LNVTGMDPFDEAKSKEHAIANQKYKSQIVHCKGGKTACKSFYIFGQPSVEYKRYNVHIDFKDTDGHFTSSDKLSVKVDLHTINSEYSKFELGWKCFFILTTLVVMFLPEEGFLIRLLAVPYRLWSFEQTWVLTLLVGLIFFNDPFFAAQLYTHKSDSMAILYIFFTTAFLGIVLLFWLCVLDEMRTTDSGGVGSMDTGRRRPFAFYTPKLTLVTLIWTLLMTTYAYVRLERLGDPTYEGLDDWVLLDIEIVLAVLLFIYCLYLFALLILSFSRIVGLSPPFKFLFSITLIVYVSVMT
ncbi:TMEM181, partial [Symbiodinium microadriaticum]